MLDNKRQYKSDELDLGVDPEEITQNQLLIPKKDSSGEAGTDLATSSKYDVRFRNFDENEEATKMQQMTCL